MEDDMRINMYICSIYNMGNMEVVMPELTDEMIERIRHSGRVHGIEDFREALCHYRDGDYINIPVRKFYEIREHLEKNDIATRNNYITQEQVNKYEKSMGFSKLKKLMRGEE